MKLQLTTDPTDWYTKSKLPELRCHKFAFAEPPDAKKPSLRITQSFTEALSLVAIFQQDGLLPERNCVRTPPPEKYLFELEPVRIVFQGR